MLLCHKIQSVSHAMQMRHSEEYFCAGIQHPWQARECQEAWAASVSNGGGDDRGLHGGLDPIRNFLRHCHCTSHHPSRPQTRCCSCVLCQNCCGLQPCHLRLYEQAGKVEAGLSQMVSKQALQLLSAESHQLEFGINVLESRVITCR